MLLNCAANLRENIVGIGADEPYRPHDDDQNHRQHHSVFGDVLTPLIVPQLM